MARRRAALKTVTSSAWISARNWIVDHPDSVQRIGRSFERVRIFLDESSKQDWAPGPDGKMVFEIVIPNLVDGTTESLGSDVRKYLHAASVALSKTDEEFNCILNVSYLGGRRFSPYWEAPPRAQAANIATPVRDGPLFSRIAIFGKLWPTEFSAEFMRGLHSMARELELEIIDCRTANDIGKQGEGYLTKEAKQFNPATTSLLIAFDNTDAVNDQSYNLNKNGYYVTAIGHRQKSIAINNHKLAVLLAEQCDRDQPTSHAEPKPIVHLMGQVEQSTAHDYVKRTSVLKEELGRFNRFEIQNGPILDLPAPPYDIPPLMIAEVEKALRQIDANRAVALFPRLDQLTKPAIRFIASNEEFKHIRIYSEKMLSRDLAMLSDKDTPLWAACGVDPYYYGRYAVRVASMRDDQTRFPEAQPVLITKHEAIKQHIVSADRIPPLFKGCDVQLNDRKFAWHDWMQKRCRRSFGPDFLARLQGNAANPA